MGNLNLHCHSKYSDGQNSIEEIAATYKMLSFDCAVITDHLYSVRVDGDPYLEDVSLNLDKYLKTVAEARAFEEEHDFPCIVGVELGYNRMEEVLVFGHEAILEIFRTLDRKVKEKVCDKFGIAYIDKDDLARIRKEYNCATVLCHPGNPEKVISDGHLENLDGFEYANSGRKMFRHRNIPERFSEIHSLSNSDAHHVSGLIRGHNITEQRIKSEQDIINLLKDKKQRIIKCINGDATKE